ncbi:MAG: hypothetical protein Q8P31_07970 [Bacillota bacterium]|nr:hypothetical protein [Bacillota bacterium]
MLRLARLRLALTLVLVLVITMAPIAYASQNWPGPIRRELAREGVMNGVKLVEVTQAGYWRFLDEETKHWYVFSPHWLEAEERPANQPEPDVGTCACPCAVTVAVKALTYVGYYLSAREVCQWLSWLISEENICCGTASAFDQVHAEIHFGQIFYN